MSSTQGGWTWLSSEGRYMGAAAWGVMDRASNPYYRQAETRISSRPNGEITLNREMANWPTTVRLTLQAPTDRHPR